MLNNTLRLFVGTMYFIKSHDIVDTYSVIDLT